MGPGATCYEPLWWQAGRWVQLSVATGAAPLRLHAFELRETGYPLESSASFSCDDAALEALVEPAARTLQCCMHETYMDCPYWEQLQYMGDTRLQILLTFVTSLDTRLAEKALGMFPYGMIGSSPFPPGNYPSRSIQIIPPFALWWICMLHDFALWRGRPHFVAELLPTAWWIIDHFLLRRRDDGLLESPRGWNYIDAVAFPGGEPPGAVPGCVSGPIQWQAILALNALRDLSTWLGQEERAALANRLATELAQACDRSFWSSKRNAFADDLDHTSFSEHSQALALLSGRLPDGKRAAARRALIEDAYLVRAGSYFSYYVCLALHESGAADHLLTRLRGWKRYLDAGLHTFPEHDLQGRSDCHAWSAHPLFHLFHGVLGIQPGAFGFESVLIAPLPGALREVSGKLPHPRGTISVHLRRKGSCWEAAADLPEGLEGTLQWGTDALPLRVGAQALRLPLQSED
jgi:hypothetical protein